MINLKYFSIAIKYLFCFKVWLCQILKTSTNMFCPKEMENILVQCVILLRVDQVMLEIMLNPSTFPILLHTTVQFVEKTLVLKKHFLIIKRSVKLCKNVCCSNKSPDLDHPVLFKVCQFLNRRISISLLLRVEMEDFCVLCATLLRPDQTIFSIILSPSTFPTFWSTPAPAVVNNLELLKSLTRTREIV